MKKRRKGSLSRKFLLLSLPTVAIAIALTASSVIPFWSTNARIAETRRAVALAAAAEHSEHFAASATWDVTESIVAGRRDARLARDRERFDSSFAMWRSLDPPPSTALRLDAISTALTRVRPLDDTLIIEAERGNAAVAMKRFWDEALPIFINDVQGPLDAIVSTRRAPLEAMFVRLAGTATAFSGATNQSVASHVALASTSSEEVGLAAGFVSKRLTQARFLGAYVLGVEPDTQGVERIGADADNALASWRAAVEQEQPYAAERRRFRSFDSADAQLAASLRHVIAAVHAGDRPTARLIYSGAYVTQFERDLRSADAAMAADEREVGNETARVIATVTNLQLLSLVAVLILLAAASGSLYAVRRISRWTARLSRAASDVGSAHVGVRVSADGNDELAELARAFNVMSADVTAAHDRASKLLERTVQTAESERQNLAAELHDGPVQRLTVVLYDLERIALRLDRDRVDEARALTTTLKGKVSQEIAALRHLMSELRPPALEHRGLGAALEDYVSGFAKSEAMKCTVDVALPERLAPSVETTVYRIVQESLANVAKHSSAHNVAVHAWTDNRATYVSIEDDGRGFDPSVAARRDTTDHFGINAMVERAKMAGGRVDVTSILGTGTKVRASFPKAVRLAS